MIRVLNESFLNNLPIVEKEHDRKIIDNTIKEFYDKGKQKHSVIVKNIYLIEDITLKEKCNFDEEVNCILYNNTNSDKTVTVKSENIYLTPDNEDLILLVKPGSYSEVNFLNIDGIYYVRGV